jgi:hypothetical protein
MPRMSTTTRTILIAACVVVLFYLAVQFGSGLSDDPRLQSDPPVAAGPED